MAAIPTDQVTPVANKRLFVTWTMDCEAVRPETAATGGPETWELSEQAMRGYVETLAACGQRVTLFLTPRVAEKQTALVLELAAQGAELGMHLHPQTIDFGYHQHLGQLPAAVQQTLLTSARDRLARALGRPPVSVRPGCFSASDETFGLLADLGFGQGSVSLPGRNLPAMGAVWASAEPFAHYACSHNRLLAGDLPFLEVPTAVNLEQLRPEAAPADPDHLRLERSGLADWAPALIRLYLQRQVERDLPMKTILIMTHNTRRYDDAADRCRGNLELVADTIAAAADTLGLTPVPATLADLHAAVLA